MVPFWASQGLSSIFFHCFPHVFIWLPLLYHISLVFFGSHFSPLFSTLHHCRHLFTHVLPFLCFPFSIVFPYFPLFSTVCSFSHFPFFFSTVFPCFPPPFPLYLTLYPCITWPSLVFSCISLFSRVFLCIPLFSPAFIFFFPFFPFFSDVFLCFPLY